MVTPYQDLTLPFGGVTLWMNSSHAGDSGGVLDKNWFFALPSSSPLLGSGTPLGRLLFLWGVQIYIWFVSKT